jgi:hypothetical protein
MFTPLLKSERFLTEYERFKSEIDVVTDDKLKELLEGNLLSLKLTVQSIDEAHGRLTLGEKPGTEIEDLRVKIRDLRQAIDSRLRAWRENL